MFTLKKEKGKDFKILNLTDIQIHFADWPETRPQYKVLDLTLRELINRTTPDLITISGDISGGEGMQESYKNFADYIDKFGIPWAFVWGNHDVEDGIEIVEEIGDLYLTYKNCIFEKGDKELGNGNYVIEIEEDGKTVEALIMMDTHADDIKYLLDGDCNLVRNFSYASLTDKQLKWYENEVNRLNKKGATESILFIHIPFYAYREAFLEVTEDDKRINGAVSIEDSYQGVGWKDEYKDRCFGVKREAIGSPNYDDGVFNVISKLNHTKNVIAGHEHINNFSIPYKGIRLSYALKTGVCAYADRDLNGGTLITIDENGVKDLHHEYVSISDELWQEYVDLCDKIKRGLL